MEAIGDAVVLEQLLVADGEQGTAQRGEDRQLIVRPFDRHQRGAQRLDLVAIVKRLAAHEQVLHAARLERFDVGPRDVFAEAHEAPEENADVARLHRDAPAGRVALGDGPAALRHQPVDKGADRVREALLDLPCCDEPLAIRFGHGQHDDGRLPGVVVP